MYTKIGAMREVLVKSTSNKRYASAYNGLTKCAELITALQPHQLRVRDRIRTQPGLVVAHGLGTGKTLSSIAAADALGMPTTVVVPAALQANYRKELATHRRENAAGIDITSLQRMARGGGGATDLQNKLLIIDEAHRLREPSGSGRKVFNKLKTGKRLLLTASPIYNHPADLASLVNLASGEPLLPTDRREFEKAFTRTEITHPGLIGRLMGARPGERKVLTNTKYLKNVLDTWVDFHESENKDDFPTSDVKIIKVPMSEKQQDVNDALLRKAPLWVQYKIRKGLPPSKQEAQQLNAFLGMQRQVSNSPQAYSQNMSTEEAVTHSPKIQRAARNFMSALHQNPNHKAVVYSNYLQSGLHPYKHILEQNKIPYGIFSGEMPKQQRDQLVKDYNDNKIKALLISTAGAEGLDLKGTRQIQILDPHFNEEKINQVVGRGIRYKSHAHLPANERHVSVERYLATHKPSRWKFLDDDKDISADQYIHNAAHEKLKLNTQFTDLLRPVKPPTLQLQGQDSNLQPLR